MENKTWKKKTNACTTHPSCLLTSNCVHLCGWMQNHFSSSYVGELKMGHLQSTVSPPPTILLKHNASAAEINQLSSQT